jgi:trimethylamine:corrinoid methyltransferase-like protein
VGLAGHRPKGETVKLSRLETLSEAEVLQIHDASLDILDRCGVRVLNRSMLEFLAGGGLSVDIDSQTVRFSRASVEDALASVPTTFEVYDRNDRPVFTLGNGEPRIAAGHNAIFWVDSETGKTRNSTVEDVKRFACICDRLEAIDMIGIPVMPQDIPDPRASLLYGVRACIENSTKPIYFSTDNARINSLCIALLRGAFCGDMAEHAYGISQLSSTSPLFWEEGVIDAVRDTVMDEEMAAMSRRIARGIRVDADTIAADTVKEIGPGGTYLTAGHTLEWLHSDEYTVPRVSVRAPRASWEAAGAKSTADLAREKATALWDSTPAPLDPERRKVLDEIMSSVGEAAAHLVDRPDGAIPHHRTEGHSPEGEAQCAPYAI